MPSKPIDAKLIQISHLTLDYLISLADVAIAAAATGGDESHIKTYQRYRDSVKSTFLGD